MKRMEDAKKIYDSVPIPEELSERVMMEVKRSKNRKSDD